MRTEKDVVEGSSPMLMLEAVEIKEVQIKSEFIYTVLFEN